MNWFSKLAIYNPDGKISDAVADLGFGKALLVSLIAIVLVFLVLCIIIGAVKLMQVVYDKFGKKEAAVATKPAPVAQAQKSVEIVDEDMMVAALIATIDYTNETKKDVKLKSIKRIG